MSADGIAVSTASCVWSASTLAAMIVCETSGRTASCSSTLHSTSPSAARRGRSCVVACLGTFQNLRDLAVIALLHNGAHVVQVTGRHHHHDLVHGSDCCIAAMVCSMIEALPATLISCLGMFRPMQVPVPPARITTTLRDLVPGDPTVFDAAQLVGLRRVAMGAEAWDCQRSE